MLLKDENITKSINQHNKPIRRGKIRSLGKIVNVNSSKTELPIEAQNSTTDYRRDSISNKVCVNLNGLTRFRCNSYEVTNTTPRYSITRLIKRLNEIENLFQKRIQAMEI